MVKVMVYNDGWVVAWFDKESQNQGGTGGCSYIDAQTLGGFGTFCEYPDKWNGCLLKVTSSSPTDPECPDGSVFCIRNTDSNLNQIQVHATYDEDPYTVSEHFNIGHTYTVEIYQDNGNLVWWEHNSNSAASPTNMSNRLYRAIYEVWETLTDNSNSTGESLNPVTCALYYDEPNYTNETTDVNDVGTNDFQLLPSTEQVNDAFYFGHSNPFSGVTVEMYQAGVGNAVTWEYWNGAAWAVLTVTDNTLGWTVSGISDCTWTPPGDWAKTIVDTNEYYWVRARCSTAAYTTCPRGNQAWLLCTPYHVDYENSPIGMYSFEDTAANYCLLCGVNEQTYYVDQDDAYFYNTSLPTKTIYKHSISCGGYCIGSASEINFYVNDKSFLKINQAYMRYSNGYIIFNIKTIAGTPAIQNIFNCSGESISNYRYTYGSMASVLITG